MNRSGEVGQFEMDNLSSPPGYGRRYPTSETFLKFIPLVFVAMIAACCGCNRTPQLRLESRTHGYDFVDEHGDVLATATSLEEIGPTLNKPAVKSKLANSKMSVQFYHVSRRYKGFQVPDGITCHEIVETFDTELAAHGTHEFEINYDNW